MSDLVGIIRRESETKTALAELEKLREALVVCVTARPAGGAATQAALRAVADALGVPRRDVTLVTGATSRDKVIEVAGPPAALARRLGELLGS
jgi:uncharacterized protein